ncbi:hypothetical protein DPEC_G00107050 [Dallia pectoralis]|uniref:Uncharacterized protein n=1 Tax=Dallia pectoralis TaxID=75939 RepID=A0ACC2GZB7_DALPE|nr:hypothetical protein DPEC_G00107050 [Dallia pectoralis]
MKALKDRIAELEQDFFLFREETSNNIHQLLSVNSHQGTQQLQQLCSAIKQLEEDNQDLRQELRRVREELVRREQHGHTLDRLLEETRSMLHTKHQQCVSTQTHSVPTPERIPSSAVSAHPKNSSFTPESIPTTAQHQQHVRTQSRSSFTPDSPQAHQTPQRKVSSCILQPTTPPTSTGREKMSKDNIVILCDSNGHHLDHRRLFPGRSVKKFWCPTPHSALKLLRDGVLGAPSHIILHTGTNDLSARENVTKALSNVVKTSSRIYPGAKIIISTLLPRRDVPQGIIDTINCEIANICASTPNVHMANHRWITHEHLYDRVHIDREGMRLFARTIKESALKPPQKTHNECEERVRQTDSYTAIGARTGRSNSTDLSQIRHMLKIICDNMLA